MQSAERSFGTRLSAQFGRLQLLCTHLIGRALARRIEVEDLVQETCLRAWKSAHAAPPVDENEVALWRWLAELARHSAIDAARAARAAKRSAQVARLDRSSWSRVGAHESELAAQTAGPATRAAASDETARLARAFRELDPEHRRVIGLRQLEGLSAAETARRLGKSETAVHSLYRRALLAWSEKMR